ncbi:MAG: hypothetical protein AAF805_14160 [Planctomycetota bacterium]
MPPPKRRKPNRRPAKGGGARGGGGQAGGGGGPAALGVEKLPGDAGYTLKPRKCAKERSDDLDEVRQMVEAGETEIAVEELRWLLSGCPELLDAHLLLGQIAVAEGDEQPSDLELARGHFGFAFRLGEKAIEAARCPGPIRGDHPANAAWHESARGLAWCLEKQGNGELADRVAATVRRMDPADPAEVTAMLDELRAGGLPIVELG